MNRLQKFVEQGAHGERPATDATYNVDAFVDEETSLRIGQRVADFQNRCKTLWTPTRVTVVFPSGLGGSSYTINRELPGELIDDETTDGRKAIVVAGCFVYKTANSIHRSSFCYFFNAKVTKPGNWNICHSGNDAD